MFFRCTSVAPFLCVDTVLSVAFVIAIRGLDGLRYLDPNLRLLTIPFVSSITKR
jgi:hypothetical protein